MLGQLCRKKAENALVWLDSMKCNPLHILASEIFNRSV